MNLTNKYSLPEGLVQVVQKQLHPPKVDRFSVTALTGPPLIRTLQLERWDEIETDVSDYLWLLLGTGVDTVLSNTNTKDNIVQHKMEEVIDGKCIVGIADIINNSIIDDYKCTSVYSYLLGEKPEWTSQLNCYAYLRHCEHLRNSTTPTITGLRIQAILRDWQKSKTWEKDYPPIAFQVINLDLWSFEQQEEYIKSRLRDHIENSHRECTPTEKWQSDDSYAVMKDGRKSALRVLDSEQEAVNWCNINGYLPSLGKSTFITKRPGQRKRCSEYCCVRSVCEYAHHTSH